MARAPVSTIPREMLQHIFVKLPPEDIARCCCVCTLWRSVVGNASFREVHAASYVAVKDQALLVSEKCETGGCAEAKVLDLSSGKVMCSVANPPGYRLANVCSGFLCFAHSNGAKSAVVCNPVTGQTMELPEAPPPLGGALRHAFALGFSPSTKEYKLFRLSYSDYYYPSSMTTANCTDEMSIMDVCTLGDNRGWRQHPYPVPHRRVNDGSPPVLIDGMLYVVTCGPNKEKRPDTILQIDVATEAHCTYRLPDFEDPLDDVRVNVLELAGQLRLAVNTVHWCRPKLIFWVMAVEKNDQGQLYYYWRPRYSFYLDVNLTCGGTRQYDCYSDLPRSAWLDDDDMLCYRVGDTLYQYDTQGYSPCSHVGFLPWDEQQLLLPATADESPSTDRWWNVCGGYRPTLLSPLTFALPPSLLYEHVLARALRGDNDSKRRRRRSNCNERAAKRIC